MTTMTAAQRRARAKTEFEAYMAACPTQQLMTTLGNKWSTMLLLALAPGPRRYADLAREMPGVSAKMLTQTLRLLERDGFVARTVTPAVPVQVDYSLTGLGERAIPLVEQVRDWAEANISDVHAARARHDAEAQVAGR
ncbi:DNA-binding HxlR family transcriptional regulator [Actinomadura namibiensis]|uniref:DNA-binding HxlR family transcriptional regulator n=2 Tax=Actinomadura TaxID=1988 RepID=A0A7W3QKN7_ACTNM|nr:DNA-binding HxlR family transcriptional regulator [Actinomadura namibiensis]